MKTTYTILRPDGSESAGEVDWPRDPGYDAIAAVVRPILDGGHLEHVSVVYQGARTDMFVDENGIEKHLPRNDKATAVYRTWWLSQHPNTIPESLSAIYGPAILFNRRVWF